MSNCKICNNSAKWEGGGLFNYSGNVFNLLIYNNYAQYYGGGACNEATARMYNCTVYKNRTEEVRCGIYNSGEITNCISWNNFGGDISNKRDVRNCCFGEADGRYGNIRANPLFVNISGDASTWDFRLQNGSPCVDAGSTVKFPEMDIEGKPRPGGDGKVCMGAYESPDEYLSGLPRLPAGIFYVSISGDDSNSGLSWDAPLRNIITALDKIPYDEDLYDIWVSEGTYAEQQTLVIPGRASLYGAFSGRESAPSERNITEHPTVIDGQNEHRCVKNSGVLDGFHITRGKAIEAAGVMNSGTVAHCDIYKNNGVGSLSSYGGGISNGGMMLNCSIYQNTVNAPTSVGGGISNGGTAMDCRVYQNTAEGEKSSGGGIYNNWELINCTIYDNQAGKGGGMYNRGITSDCLVYENSASISGGGIYNEFGRTINCVVYRNKAQESGGGIYNRLGELTNCTIIANDAILGGGIDALNGTITNCISWNNSAEDVSTYTTQIRFSCFREAPSEDGNIAQDPMFMNVSGDSSSWDFRLKPESPCIDSGTSEEAPGTDILGVRRPQGSGVDMGAYEWVFTSLRQRLIDAILGRGTMDNDDMNGDGKVDSADLIGLLLEE